MTDAQPPGEQHATGRQAQPQRADALRRLHVPGRPVVLVNIWDVAGARAVAAVPGTKAIATASWAIAAAYGVPDGENVPLPAVLDLVSRICAAVDLPVTADIERGYGRTSSEVGRTIVALIGAGAVGCNLEDSLADGSVRPAAEQVGRIRAARFAAEACGVDLVINARTDVLAHGGSIPEAVERGRDYLAAGADAVFVLGATDLATVRELTTGIPGPVSVLAGESSPSITELAEAGVARVSVGPDAMEFAYRALRTFAEAANRHVR